MGNERKNVPQRTSSRRGAVLAPGGLRGASRLDSRCPSAGSSSVTGRTTATTGTKGTGRKTGRKTGRNGFRRNRTGGRAFLRNRPARNRWPNAAPDFGRPERERAGPFCRPAPLRVGARRRSGSGTTAPESSTPAETGSAENTPVSECDHDSVRSPPGNGSSPPVEAPVPFHRGPSFRGRLTTSRRDCLSARPASLGFLSATPAGKMAGSMAGPRIQATATPMQTDPSRSAQADRRYRSRSATPSRSRLRGKASPNGPENEPEPAGAGAATGRENRSDRERGTRRVPRSPGRSQSEA